MTQFFSCRLGNPTRSNSGHNYDNYEHSTRHTVSSRQSVIVKNAHLFFGAVGNMFPCRVNIDVNIGGSHVNGVGGSITVW